MRNLYPKGKGKIHPSPSPSGPSGATSGGDAVAVLSLLPAAILALTAALGAEDREVLAYMVTRSPQGPWSVVPEERRRCRRQGLHRPLFDCGCFDCYTSYWFRWDSSPDRELIHQAIEAFEEHLASSEQQRSGGKGSRRRDRRLGEPSDKTTREADEKSNGRRKSGKSGEEKAPSNSAEAAAGDQGPSEGRSSPFRVERDDPVEAEPEEAIGCSDGEPSELDGGGTGMEMVEMPQQPGDERRRPWADVMGLFSSRFWSLWSPAA